MNFYNDNDPKICAWLRELINQNLIPNGVVDSRSIELIQPDELKPYTQCHFFCGVAGWSEALRLAGWPETKPVWTGSCPCQPLSCAGQRKGHADQRHLWPAFYNLIAKCKPTAIFGEQVDGKDGREWLAGVRADLEGTGYAVGVAGLCAASVGAPHIRQRLFWVADSESKQHNRSGDERNGWKKSSDDCRMGDTDHPKKERFRQYSRQILSKQKTEGFGCSSEWSDYEIIHCLDGKYRRTQSGVSPLALGVPRNLVPIGYPSEQEAQTTGEARVMRLRGYGNSICVPLAAKFIEAFLES